MSSRSLLDELRSRSKVDCDTLDVEVAKALGPFVDCTSNQAIAFIELQKPANEPIIKEGVQLTRELHSQYSDEVTVEQLATEVLTVFFSSRVTPYLTGNALIQVNPYNAYSSSKIISNARRFIHIYQKVQPDFPSSRVCIKIPSTWEGIQACRALEREGIRTLATTLFTIEQAALAADAGCTYIAPYVNELPVHFVPGHVDNDRGTLLTRSAQRYYARIHARTLVMPASLTTVAEVMQLAGAHHITVTPPLLAALASTPSDAAAAGAEEQPAARWFDEEEEAEADEVASVVADCAAVLSDEGAYRMAFTRSKEGRNEKKLVDAINIFAGFQDRMEEVVRGYL